MKTRIKNLREDNDLTQNDISKILNISQVAYSYYELNKRSIPLELLSKLADYYNTSIDYLVYRTDEIKPYKKAKNWNYYFTKCFQFFITKSRILISCFITNFTKSF